MAANDPMTKTSLYVGDLHPEVIEKDLYETFALVGPLISVHLCRDKLSGKSLCYAYVNFWIPCHAATALQCLNHRTLRGKSMRIMWYERYPTARKSGTGNLFVKNLDQSITSARLQTVFSKFGTILSCKVVEEKGMSKGFGFVQFDSEDSAMAALNALHDAELEGKKLYVSKFQKKSDRKGLELGLINDKFSEHRKVSRTLDFDSREAITGELTGSKNLTVGRPLNKAEYNYADHLMEMKASNLFVRNLDASVDDKKLEELFSTYGKVISANVIRAGHVSKGYGFVCFSSPDDAKKALSSLSGADFEGRTLYVAVALPRKEETRNFYKPSGMSPTPCSIPHISSPIPSIQPIPWYQHIFSPFSSSNPIQAQSIKSTFYALPMPLSTLSPYGQGRSLEIPKGQKPPFILQGKIINGDEKKLCNRLGSVHSGWTRFILHKVQPMQLGSSNVKELINGDGIRGNELSKGSVSMKSTPESGKMKPVYMHCPLVQNLQEKNDSQGMLNSPQISAN